MVGTLAIIGAGVIVSTDLMVGTIHGTEEVGTMALITVGVTTILGMEVVGATLTIRGDTTMVGTEALITAGTADLMALIILVEASLPRVTKVVILTIKLQIAQGSALEAIPQEGRQPMLETPEDQVGNV